MTAASALPVLPPNEEGRVVTERVNALIRFYNRPDLFVPSYAVDTGSGTAYVTSPSTDIRVYEVGQEFDFKAATANTVTNPTLNVQSLGAGTITKAGGVALVLGDIAANTFYKVIVTSTTPTFQLLSPSAAFSSVGATTFMVGNTAVGNGTFTNLCNTGSIGANGQTWLIMAQAVGISTGGQTLFSIVISDGTNNITGAETVTPAANQDSFVSCAKVVALTAATTFTLKGEGNNATTSALAGAAGTGMPANAITGITAVRLS